MIDSSTRAAVIARANGQCEYCQLPQQRFPLTFQIEHVIASQHRHDDTDSNLAWACPRCNRKKGPNLSAIDPATQSIVPLFHPRQQVWDEHFRWSGPLIVGTTNVGRATVALLEMNDPERVKLRQSLISEKIIQSNPPPPSA